MKIEKVESEMDFYVTALVHLYLGFMLSWRPLASKSSYLEVDPDEYD